VEAQRYDFFISYTSVDKEWALWLVVQLENAGYRTFSQVMDMSPGQDWVNAMERACVPPSA
jgi:hypothetical protein